MAKPHGLWLEDLTKAERPTQLQRKTVGKGAFILLYFIVLNGAFLLFYFLFSLIVYTYCTWGCFTAEWMDICIGYQVFPLINRMPTWHHR